MSYFNQKPGTKSAVHDLKTPIPGITEFDTIVRSVVRENPFGCVSYYHKKKHHPPVEIVREMYTAKFVYEDEDGKRAGTGQETYNSVDGYQYGIAAVLSNLANFSAHKGKARHIPGSDLFSVILKCQDPSGEYYFLSLARDRVTVSSYEDDAIKDKIGEWVDSVPELA